MNQHVDQQPEIISDSFSTAQKALFAAVALGTTVAGTVGLDRLISENADAEPIVGPDDRGSVQLDIGVIDDLPELPGLLDQQVDQPARLFVDPESGRLVIVEAEDAVADKQGLQSDEDSVESDPGQPDPDQEINAGVHEHSETSTVDQQDHVQVDPEDAGESAETTGSIAEALRKQGIDLSGIYGRDSQAEADTGEISEEESRRKGGGGPVELEELPELDPITPEIRESLAENTVYFSTMGCSGYLVRDSGGQAIGATTAEHCGLRDSSLQRLTDENGVDYVEPFSDLRVGAGDTLEVLQDAGKITHIIVPPAEDTQEDLAILVFEGQNPEDVYDAVTSAPQMQQGDTGYMSGWPLDQDNNGPGEWDRQVFSMVYLGSRSETGTSIGEELKDLEYFALKSNEDGAECSFGASGSAGIYFDEQGEEQFIGTLAVFDEMTPDTWQTVEGAQDVKDRHEFEFGVNLDGYDVVCGFSTRRLAFSEMQVLEVRESAAAKQSREFVPNMDQTRQEAFEEFVNPNIPKQYIDGVFIEHTIDDNGSYVERYYRNPLVYIGDKGIFLYWQADDFSAEGVEEFAGYFSNGDELYRSIVLTESQYQRIEAGESILQSTEGGGMARNTDGSTGWIDEAGTEVGGRDAVEPEGQAYSVSIRSDGAIRITREDRSANGK